MNGQTLIIIATFAVIAIGGGILVRDCVQVVRSMYRFHKNHVANGE